MKGMVTIVAFLGMTLFVSCSWMKRTNPVLPVSESANPVEPTPAQQEAAMQMLREEAEKAAEKTEEKQEATLLMIREPQQQRERAANEDQDDDMLVDPAQQRGLRSPALPKLLPMDMNGKLNPGM